MDLPDSFAEIWRRLLAGDDDAATRIFDYLKPRIERRAARLMRLHQIPCFYGGDDTCAWVLGRFLVHVQREQRQYPNVTEVLKYTLAMTRYRVLDLARRRRQERCLQAKRPTWRITSLDEVIDTRTNPGEMACRHETVEQVRRHLPAHDWRIVWLRAQGKSWQEIARQVDSTPDAARIQHSRVVARVRCKFAS